MGVSTQVGIAKGGGTGSQTKLRIKLRTYRVATPALRCDVRTNEAGALCLCGRFALCSLRVSVVAPQTLLPAEC